MIPLPSIFDQPAGDDHGRSGLAFEDAPGEPTAAELALFTPPPEPEHTPRVRRTKRVKKSMAERVFNKDLSLDTQRGDFSRPIAKVPARAEELTPTQIFRLFEQRIHWGHPADLCYSMYRLKPSAEDIAHIEWVCMLNIRQWMTSLRMATYAGLPRNAHGFPNWDDAEAVKPAEDNLMDFLAVYRRRFAEEDPVRGHLYDLCERGVTTHHPDMKSAVAAVAELQKLEWRENLRQRGMPESFIEKEMTYADRVTERNRRGSCGGMEA